MSSSRTYQMRWLTIVVFAVSSAPAFAITGTPSWKPKETVDPFAQGSGSDAADRMLAYDHHGNPGISFIDGIDLSLDYARRVPGVGWASVEVDPNGGQYPSLAFDRYERPAISYTEATSPADLRFAHFDGSVWQLETASFEQSSFTSLAFDILGRPAIAYAAGASLTLKYVHDTDGDLTFTDETPVTVSAGSFTGVFPSLAFDSTNRPMIAHGDISANELLFSVEEPGIGWVTSTVVSNPAAGASLPSLAVDPDTDFPAIAFGGGASGLQYAEWNGVNWGVDPVDPNSGVGSRVSLAFDPADGHPAISYENDINVTKQQNFAWHNGSIWQAQTVDTGGNIYLQSSLAFNDFGNGFASIAFLDESGQLSFIEDPPAVVPEPASVLLMLIALVNVSAKRRRPAV